MFVDYIFTLFREEHTTNAICDKCSREVFNKRYKKAFLGNFLFKTTRNYYKLITEILGSRNFMKNF
jgi:hypothetical protein